MTMGSDAAGLASFDSASRSALSKVTRFTRTAEAKELAEGEELSTHDVALKRIFAKIHKQLTTPLLRAETRQAYWAVLAENYNTYVECSEALRVVMSEMSDEAKQVDDDAFLEQSMRSISLHVSQLAADEFAFSWRTYERAMRLRDKLLASEQQPADPDRDCKLAEQYHQQSVLHNIGMLAILHAYKGVNPTKVAWEMSFDLARGGALRTYAALREAIRLRRDQVEVVPSFDGGFDREDAYLAGFTEH